MKKRIFAVLICLTLAFTYITAFAVGYGVCGESAEWSLDNQGNLAISGNGEMNNYLFAPWAEQADKIVSVSVSEGITRIGNFAFADCLNLKSVILPSTLKSIGENAFADCISLKEISIPNGIEKIESGAFSGCDLLAENKYDNAYYIGNTSNKYLVLMHIKALTTSSCSINSSTKVIYEGAFAENTAITSITVPEGVLHIGDGAFSGCEKLKSLKIPSTLQSIGAYAFYGCTALTGNLYDGVYYLGNANYPYTIIYNADSGITEFTVKNETKFIYENAFSSCSELKTLTVPGALKSIGYKAFSGCGKLSGTLTLSVEQIGNNAFEFCDSLTGVVLYNKTAEIGAYAFSECEKLTSVKMGDELKKIESSAFGNCKALTDLYYVGNEESFSKLDFTSGNEKLKNASLHLNSAYGCSHTDTIVKNAKSAVCAFDGYTGDTVCTLCGQTVTAGENIPSPGHKFSDWVIEYNDTGKPINVRSRVCEECGLRQEEKYKSIIGDVDGDGAVTPLDRMIIARYISQWSDYDKKIDIVLADVDRDGNVTQADRMIIARYISGWEGYGKYFINDTTGEPIELPMDEF